MDGEQPLSSIIGAELLRNENNYSTVTDLDRLLTRTPESVIQRVPRARSSRTAVSKERNRELQSHFEQLKSTLESHKDALHASKRCQTIALVLNHAVEPMVPTELEHLCN